MTTLPVPGAEAWTPTRLRRRSTGYVVEDTPTAQMTVDNLVPGHTLTVSIRLQPSTPATVVIGDAVTPIPAAQYSTVAETLTLTSPNLTIRVLGSNSFHVESLNITDHTQIPEYPTPAHVISVQAFFPLADIDGLRLDTSRWNRARFNTAAAPESAFTWNASRWDTREWYAPTDAYAWQDITPRVNAIHTTKEVTPAPVLSANIGTLTLDALDALDPRATGITYGTPIKVIHWPTRSVIWAGAVSDIELDYAPPGSRWRYRTTITATDNVATIAGITRYGARAETIDGAETWTNRIQRLMRSAPSVPYVIESQSHTPMCATVWETSLASHLDAAVASVNGSWYVDRENTVRITSARPPMNERIIFTDFLRTVPAFNVWSFHGINIKWKATEVTAAVYLTNHGAKKEEDTWVAADAHATAEAPTFTAAWNGATAQIDTTLTGGLDAAARALIRPVSDLPIPKSIDLSPCHRHGPTDRAERMAGAAQFDLLTPARIASNGDSHNTIITGVIHRITPHEWHTTITFTPNH